MSKKLVAFIFALTLLRQPTVAGQQTSLAQGTLTGEELVRRVEASVVLILVGEGGGRLTGMGSGLIIGSGGALLTAYHLIKNAHEVQVRLKSGETYDRVELVGFDERRAVAALRIPAGGLPELPFVRMDQLPAGEPVYVLSNPSGRGLSVSDGILTGLRLADEVPNAGTGYRLLQFITSVPVGLGGGVLIDSKGRALGLIVSRNGGQVSNFAIPVESVVGLASGGSRTELGSGMQLHLPPAAPPAIPGQTSAGTGGPADFLRPGRKIFLTSRTVWFKPELLQQELFKQAEFTRAGMLIVTDPKMADLMLVVNRPLLTYDFTFTLTDAKATMVFASGKVTAIDGRAAAPRLAKAFADQLQALRAPRRESTRKD